MDIDIWQLYESTSLVKDFINIVFYFVLTVVVAKVGLSLDSLIKGLKQKIEYEHSQKVEWDKQEALERQSTLEDVWDG